MKKLIITMLLLVSMIAPSHGGSLNIANGELSHTFELFALPEDGFIPDFSLTYASLRSFHHLVGEGWNLSVQIILEDGGPNTLRFYQGETVRLFGEKEGGWVPWRNDGSSLQKNPDGSYVLVWQGRHYDFGPDMLIRSVTEADGRKTVYTHVGGFPARIQFPGGKVVSMSYTGKYLTGITDPKGKQYWITYEGVQPTAILYPDGTSWRFTYNVQTMMETKTDRDDKTWKYFYDKQNRLVNAMDHKGQNYPVQYPDTEGEVHTTTYTDTKGEQKTTTFSTTHGGKILEEVDQKGSLTNYTYDNEGRMLSKTLPSGETESYSYDHKGRVISQTSCGVTRNYTYDEYDNVVAMTDSQGNAVRFEYNTRGQMTKATDPHGETVTYQYDQDGNLVAITDPEGRTHSVKDVIPPMGILPTNGSK